jgi:hypothetical protein
VLEGRFRDRTDEAILALSIVPLSKRLSRKVSGTLKKAGINSQLFVLSQRNILSPTQKIERIYEIK